MTDSRPARPCCAALDAARALDRGGRLAEAATTLAATTPCEACRAPALTLRGSLAARLGDNPAADRWLVEAIAQTADAPDTLVLHGVVLRRLGRPQEAHERYVQALALAPRHVGAHVNDANILNDLGRWREALEAAERAAALQPALAAAANARGVALAGLGRGSEAMAAFGEAIRLDPPEPTAHVNLGNSLVAAGRAEEALASYEAAVALAPDRAGAWTGLANARAALRRWPEAAAAYDQAYALAPRHPGLMGQRLHSRMRLCDWTGYGESRAEIAAELDAGRLPSTPFVLLPVSGDPMEERRCAEAYARSALVRPAAPLAAPPPGPRIRVGYFSADLHSHATAHLMADLFETHDRAAFEVTAFSYGPRSDDPVRRRLAGAFERFFDVSRMDDPAVVSLARGLDLDIAVDLKGYTLGARSGIFLERVAPVQVSYVGYPGTLGAPFIDYLVADPVLIPEDRREAYSEKIAYLPDSYQPNDRRRALPPAATARGDHGLPAEGFVFGCFNNAYKITPDAFAAWMRILRGCEGAVLWLYRETPAAADNLRASAVAAGVAAERLVFADPLPHTQHLERLRHMDLFLDTSPYGAHTTASDALWMGTPLVARMGETFAARVAGSLLTAVGAPELIATSWEAYEALAVALFRDPPRLAELRRRLEDGRASAPLFGTPKLTRHLEGLYRTMHARRVAGLAPDHIAAD